MASEWSCVGRCLASSGSMVIYLSFSSFLACPWVSHLPSFSRLSPWCWAPQHHLVFFILALAIFIVGKLDLASFSLACSLLPAIPTMEHLGQQSIDWTVEDLLASATLEVTDRTTAITARFAAYCSNQFRASLTIQLYPSCCLDRSASWPSINYRISADALPSWRGKAKYSVIQRTVYAGQVVTVTTMVTFGPFVQNIYLL